MGNVLVLNRNFYAIHVASWQKAISLMYRDEAYALDDDCRRYSFDEWKDLSQMIEDNPNGYVRSVNFKIAVPEVIVLAHFDRLPDSEVKFTRKNIYHHYNNRCCYCGKRYGTKELNLDHILPKSRGGKSTWENIVLSCIPCNGNKDNRTPSEAGMKMHYQSSAPTWKPGYAICVKTGMRVKKSWQKFVDSCYWNSEIES